MADNSKSWDGYSIKKKLDVPEGLWCRCPGCEEMIFNRTLEENLQVCPECNYHFRISARKRIEILCDEQSFEEMLGNYSPLDPLKFSDLKTYKSRLKEQQKKTGQTDAAVVGKGYVKGRPLILAVLDPEFMMGSMGSVVGEKIAVAAETAQEAELPLVIVSSSGGARMQEGVLSLSQMAKTSAAIARLNQSGGLYISILADPTTGGVAASFALLGDIIIAEPGALIGFAGARTIWHTIKVELPEGFQKAEFLLEHGFIDMITPRNELRSEIARLIDYCGK
ncbi:MAG: acetyl-CoA carboxylase carboxyltransferase subunit beta [Sedimentisphaerales bacterium]|nr:acetyl-CoA carboxylase carboxyltransferase subunit beta [Sedimentisphaerales bacterium]